MCVGVGGCILCVQCASLHYAYTAAHCTCLCVRVCVRFVCVGVACVCGWVGGCVRACVLARGT